MSVSIAMLVKNPPIERMIMLIAYMSSICDDFIIVDTGSDKNKIETMKAWKDVTIIEREWPNDFAKARNYAFEFCKNPWTLVLDPDELPSVGMMSHIASASLGLDGPRAYLYWTVNFIEGKLQPKHDHDWHIRLMQTDHARFYRAIDELVEIDGKHEGLTRGTPLCPFAPDHAVLIHSKTAEDLERSKGYYT